MNDWKLFEITWRHGTWSNQNQFDCLKLIKNAAAVSKFHLIRVVIVICCLLPFKSKLIAHFVCLSFIVFQPFHSNKTFQTNQKPKFRSFQFDVTFARLRSWKWLLMIHTARFSGFIVSSVWFRFNSVFSQKQLNRQIKNG